MGGLWVVAEPGPDGSLARISTEVATLARDLAAAANLDVIGIVVAPRTCRSSARSRIRPRPTTPGPPSLPATSRVCSVARRRTRSSRDPAPMAATSQGPSRR